MSRVIVPFELPDPESLSQGLVDELASVEAVVVLGHYDLPEQTPASVAGEQFGDDAQATVDEIAERFREAGAQVVTRVVFGKDRGGAIEEIANEEGCIAELIPRPTDGMDRILVPIPDAEITRLPEFVQLVYNDQTEEITLLHVRDGTSGEDSDERVTRARDQLVDAGFDPSLVETTIVESGDHGSEIRRLATEHDAVVMYEAESRLGDFVFGSLPDRIANETDNPVLVVQRDYEPRLQD